MITQDGAGEAEPAGSIDLRETSRAPVAWSVAVMQAAGIGYIAEARGEAGELIGYDIDPPLSQSDYDAVAGDALKQELKAYAAELRWQREVGGIMVNDHTIDTSRASQAMIAAADALAQVEPDESIDFKAASGWVALDSTTVHQIALEVGRHVRRLFRTERQVCAAIDTGTIATMAGVAAAFEPEA